MPQDPWLHFLSVVGATFWRGFPYDIAFFTVTVWAVGKTEGRVRQALSVVAVFMAVLMAINLAIGTIPPWFQPNTW